LVPESTSWTEAGVLEGAAIASTALVPVRALARFSIPPGIFKSDERAL